jgi:hypothetical protein
MEEIRQLLLRMSIGLPSGPWTTRGLRVPGLLAQRLEEEEEEAGAPFSWSKPRRPTFPPTHRRSGYRRRCSMPLTGAGIDSQALQQEN